MTIRCRSLDVCSGDCMRALWPDHKNLCKKLALEPREGRAITRFEQWSRSLINPLVYALPSAFDLATDPTNAATKVLMLELTLIEAPRASFDIVEAELVDLVPSQRDLIQFPDDRQAFVRCKLLAGPPDAAVHRVPVCHCAGFFLQHFALGIGHLPSAFDPDWLERLRRDVRNTEVRLTTERC